MKPNLFLFVVSVITSLLSLVAVLTGPLFGFALAQIQIQETQPLYLHQYYNQVVSVKEEKGGDAIVLCLIDGSIVTLEAWTGQIRGHSPTMGGPILRGSGTVGGGGGTSTQRIVPALDGTLFAWMEQPIRYTKDNEDEQETSIQPAEFQLVELPLKIQDLVDRPVSMCYPTVSSSYSSSFDEKEEEGEEFDNTHKEQEECGIIVGQKSTHIYAINPLLGTLQSLQQPPPLFVHQHPTNPTTSTLFLQRTDYSIQHLHVHTGQELWNVTFGQLAPLDFSSESWSSLQPLSERSCPQPGSPTRRNSPSSSSSSRPSSSTFTPELPFIYFDHSQPVPFVLALDPSSYSVLWKQPLTSVVATAQGITSRRNSWGKDVLQWTRIHLLDSLPLESVSYLEIDTEKAEEKEGTYEGSLIPYYEHHHIAKEHSVRKRKTFPEWTLYLPSSSSLDSYSNGEKSVWHPSPSRDAVYFTSTALVPRVSPSSSSAVIEEHYNLHDDYSMNHPMTTLHSSCLEIPNSPHCLEDPDAHEDNGESQDEMNEEQPQDDSWSSHYGYYDFPPRYTTSHKTEHGLFLSWTLVTAMVTCLMAGVIGGRILYMRKKQKWILESHTPKFMAMYPNSNSEDGGEYQPPPLILEGAAITQNPSSEKIQSSSMLSSQAPHSSKNDTTRSMSLHPVTHMDGIPLVRYLRYRSEFDEIQALGEGGFGTVFKCCNKLDGREYAIKKVVIQSPLDQNGQLSPHFSKRFHRVLREVKILALLDHPNIVRYYTAWLEMEDESDLTNIEMEEEEEEEDGALESTTDHTSGHMHPRLQSSTNITSRGFSSDFLVGQAPQFPSSSSFNESFQHARYTSEEDLGFIWERSQGPQSPHSNFTLEESYSLNKSYDEGIQSTQREDQSVSTNDEQYSHDKRSMSSSNDMRPQEEVLKIQRHILYIQMQLSKKTLLDYFSTRHSSSQQAPVDILVVLRMFAHIIRGVKHVHQQGMIHRDLKPSNCFMDESDLVKIGDFGLSRESGVYVDEEDTSASKTEMTGSENTAGIGTSSYASPEQISGSDYDSSTDVYSLGIILFELCYPMLTGMERFKAFEGLRKSTPQFPSLWYHTVAKQFPVIHTLIQTMISHNPKDRPTADQVSTQIESLLSEYTVLLLDRNGAKRQEGSIFLRVEASDSDGVLARTIQTIKESPDVTIAQYSLQGLEDKAVMEFALILKSVPTQTGGNMGGILEVIVTRLEECSEVKVVRQLNQTNP